ncbi:MAG: hypothetical protein AAFN94_18885, partial [Pseudomonadota bacterium]
MTDLETLEAITPFSFFSGDIEDLINEFSSFSVVTLGPVVSCARLSEDQVVWFEELSERSGTNRVQNSWL